MKTIWTPELVAALQSRYASTLTSSLAAELGVPQSAVYAKAHSLGLKKSAEYLQGELRETLAAMSKQSAKSEATRFPKGNVPHNKGKAMPPSTKEKCAPTMFKKGQPPRNAKPIGYERLGKDDYIEIKTAQGFRSKHRAIWEAKFGPVPKSHIVIFRDGDKRNFDIDNLELISRVESVRRNRFVFAPEFREVLGVINQLQKAIKNAEKHIS